PQLRRRLISLGVVGCTFVRASDKFPLKSLSRIHHQQHLDSLSQWLRFRLCHLVFFVFHSSRPAAAGPLRLATAPATYCPESCALREHGSSGTDSQVAFC